jgi:hypothetical protein
VPLEQVFGSNVHKVAAQLNIEGQHRGAVAAAKAAQVRGAGVGGGWWSVGVGVGGACEWGWGDSSKREIVCTGGLSQQPRQHR